MIQPFFGCSGRTSAPMFIAEGQNILDAVLPTSSSSTAADLFSNIPIEYSNPHFDFAVDVLTSPNAPPIKTEPHHSPPLPKSSFVQSTFSKSNSNSTAERPILHDTKCVKKRKGHYDQYKDGSGKIKLELIEDDEERKRVEEKRFKNKEAAAKSRKRKKEQTEQLESDVNQLRAKTAEVEKELVRLRNLTRKLRAVKSEHEKICPRQRFIEYH
jgi:hypothetical protein